ncbi:hypothetical protein D7030_09320 [Flavobacteriaceae bacterium AU392]|nr:hypothetical protein D1817_15325 [Flavobacteriaceae bacterium]RKM84209.1 hypothetical protein D7030_09320 [Flavobacteriaceae bacterium AU392]
MKIQKSIVLLLISISCFAFTSDVQKRRVRDHNFDIECYISLKKVNDFDDNKTYYWYKSGEIHYSVSSASGSVLQNEYLKYYRSNQLAEQGNFNSGLKTGVWKQWYENGALKLKETWKNGFKDGEFITYDALGNMELRCFYKNNLKTGEWINYKTKDTVKYKKDKALPLDKRQGFIKRMFKKKAKKEKGNSTKKESFLKRIFKKAEKNKIPKKNNVVKKTKRTQANNKTDKPKKETKNNIKTDKKKGFLKHLFKKKQKPNKNNKLLKK